jgi:hypothetical protein
MQGPLNFIENGPYHNHCAMVEMKFITLLSHRDSGTFFRFGGVKCAEERVYSHGTTEEILQTCFTPSVDRSPLKYLQSKNIWMILGIFILIQFRELSQS